MIGLDSNIILRFLTQDNKRQAERALEVFQKLSPDNPGFVTNVALLEVYFALQCGYKQSTSELIDVIEGLLSSEEQVLESEEEVHSALRLYRKSKPRFNDCLLADKCRKAQCETIFSFDRDACRDLGMTSP